MGPSGLPPPGHLCAPGQASVGTAGPWGRCREDSGNPGPLGAQAVLQPAFLQPLGGSTGSLPALPAWLAGPEQGRGQAGPGMPLSSLSVSRLARVKQRPHETCLAAPQALGAAGREGGPQRGHWGCWAGAVTARALVPLTTATLGPTEGPARRCCRKGDEKLGSGYVPVDAVARPTPSAGQWGRQEPRAWAAVVLRRPVEALGSAGPRQPTEWLLPLRPPAKPLCGPCRP